MEVKHLYCTKLYIQLAYDFVIAFSYYFSRLIRLGTEQLDK